VITLADWYHKVSAQVAAPFKNDATLINGQGRAFASTQASKLTVINVVQNKRYLLRIINTSCDPNYIFSIDGHNFTVIEVDGVNHQKLPVDSLQIFAGQRYSVILTANQAVGNYCKRTFVFSSGLC
jgi:iron transport multicopper oxidase